VEQWTLAASERLRSTTGLNARPAGWIRECHGDLHLGNMVLADAGQNHDLRLYRIQR
jgi:aminoglycoside phosphotransferase family enzyme